MIDSTGRIALNIRKSQYLGAARAKFQLYLVATMPNLTLVARKPGGRNRRRYQQLGHFCMEVDHSSFDCFHGRPDRVLIPDWLALASSLEYMSPSKYSSSKFCRGSAELTTI